MSNCRLQTSKLISSVIGQDAPHTGHEMGDSIFSSGGLSSLPPVMLLTGGTLTAFDLVLLLTESPAPGAVDIQGDQTNLDLGDLGDLGKLVDLCTQPQCRIENLERHTHVIHRPTMTTMTSSEPELLSTTKHTLPKR